MKSLGMSARLFALIVCLLFSAPIGQRAFAEQGKVSGVFYLKVRTAPDFDATELGVLAEGDVVEIIGEVGHWANVILEDGTSGYVSRKYLVPITGTARREEQPGPDVQSEDDTQEPQSTHDAEVADSPPPPEKPQVPLTRAISPSPPPRGPPPCTSKDIEKIRQELGNLAAAQKRLTQLVKANARAAPPTSDWSSSLSTRQMLFWLGLGCGVGWLASAALRQRRERRQRNRIRI